MSDPYNKKSTQHSDRKRLVLWRPDCEFEADWFVAEFRWEGGEDIFPTESSIRHKLLSSALPLLREPEISFYPISSEQMFVSINSIDASIQLRVREKHIIIEVQVIENASAAIRFCENVDGTSCGGINRVRVMPDGDMGQYHPLDSGYVFGRVIKRQTTPHQTITLSEHPVYGRALVLNGEIQFGENDENLFSGSLVSHACGMEAKKILIVGGGDCGVLRQVLHLPVERVVMVEYDEDVLRFCQQHFPTIVGNSLEDDRLEIRFEDAFKYLVSCDERFDIVLSDLPDTPIGDLSLDRQIQLMSKVLTEDGRLGTHAEFNNRAGSYDAEPIIAAIKRQFSNTEIVSRVIPSYQDQTWLFVNATGPLSPG